MTLQCFRVQNICWRRYTVLSLCFFQKSIQNVSWDPGTLRDYPLVEFLCEGKMCPATRNVGDKMGLLWVLEKQRLRDQVERKLMRKNTWVVLGAASQRSCGKTLGTGGGTDLHEHMEFLRLLRDVFPSFSASLLLCDGFEIRHSGRTS